MNEPVRPSSLFGTTAAASLPSNGVGTIQNPPPEVTQLPGGTTLRGVVHGQDGKGHLLVRTELGLLQIATKASPPPGTEVVLQIRSSGGQLHVLLMHAETPSPREAGSAPPIVPPGPTAGGPASAAGQAGPATAAPRDGAAPSPAPLPPGHGSGDVLALGQTLRATVQALPATPQTAPAGVPTDPASRAPPRLEVGSRLVIRVLSVAAPSGGPTSAPAASPQAAAPGPIAAHRFQAYAAVHGRLHAALSSAHAQGGAVNTAGPAPNLGAALGGSPAGAAPTPQIASAGLQGVVLSVTHANQPVVQTPLGTLTLDASAPLPPGSRIVFEVLNRDAPRPAAQSHGPASALPATLAHRWPALEEALRVSQDAAALPAGPASPPPLDAVAQPGPRLASGLLFFLSALSAGDLGRWLGGQTLQALRNTGREDLALRLSQDFHQLARMAEAPSGEWRLMAMPVLDGHQVQQIRLWLRQHRDRERRKAQDRDREATRFILEVELSELGDLQLDGLVRGKRFDLMLRSRRGLPSDMRREIARIFDEANAIGGYSGSVGFQASNDWRFLSLDRFDDDAPTLVV